MDCPIRPEDLMSDVEPLPLSAPCSAPASPRTGPAAAPRSLPASPRSALSPSSSLVTARLYASLQNCRQLEAGRRLALEIAAGDRGSAQIQAGARREPSGKHGGNGRPARDGPRPASAPASSSTFSSQPDRRDAELSSSSGPQHSHSNRPASAIPGSQPLILSTDCPPGSRPSVDTLASRHPGLARTYKDAASIGRLAPPDLEELALEMTQKLSRRVETSSAHKAGSRHISEMESVRSHLQSMLRFSQDLTDRNDAVSPADQQQRDNDSFGSDCTSTLLRAKPFQEISVSPPAPILGLDEAALFPRYSRMQLGTRAGSVAESSLYEYQIVRDTLDKERTRRKHCEKQIQALQNKILALQQQLAVAVSADRKKDIMIEQLDKTLVKVVEGWKKHDAERSEAMRQLQEEHEAVERERGERQQAVLNFEHHLSQATQALAKEQEEKEQLEKERGLLEEEAQRLGEVLEAEQRRGLALQAECDKAEGGRLQERKQAEALRAQLREERDAREQRQQQQEQRSSQRQAELHEEVEKERVARQQEAQRAQDAQQVLSAVQTEMQRLEGELDGVSREKESLQMELSLVKARFESQRVKAETEFKVALEQQVTERLTTMHEDSSRQMAAIREQHRKQVMELGTQHEHEMGRQLAQFKLEVQEREEKHRHVMEGYELRLAKEQEETGRLLGVRRKLEVQRSEMVSKLQAMMQSHWNEALKVLMSESLSHGPQRLQHPALHDNLVPVYQELNRSLPASGLQYGTDCDHSTCSALESHWLKRPPSSCSDPFMLLARDTPGGDPRPQGQMPDHQAPGRRMESGRLPESRDPRAGFPPAIPLQPAVQASRRPQAPEPRCAVGDAERLPAAVNRQGQSQRPMPPLPANTHRVEDLSQILNYSFLSHASFQPLEPQVDEAVTAPGPHHEELAEHPFTQAVPAADAQYQRLGEGGTTVDSSLDSSAGQSFQDQSPRGSELQYYIQMLLDRSPSEPVDTSSDAETLNITPQEAESQKAGPTALPDEPSGRNGVRPQPTGQLSSGRTAGSAVHKVKVKVGRTESVPTQRGHPPQHPLKAGGVLSPKQVGELSRLLHVYNGAPDCPVPSMDELFTYLRDHQDHRPMGPESLASSTQQNQSHMLITTTKKEGLPAQPSAQKLLNANRLEHHGPNPGKEKKRPAVVVHQGGGGGSREARTAIWR
ncbi:centrobin isoform X2 [Amblyraja radiata]|uniref:centrobin isoform X2 n=1 Tax=Amblyraja radiata TaxID=386614 RepID=UPI0014022BB5|nr:centrobin isoform X2 [Amblyraja radiata]